MPRAEALAILHALRTTRGNALFVCDNWSVVSAYNKSIAYVPKGNGILWQAIRTSRGERLSKGFGFLEVVWISSHLSYEKAINQGFGHFWWIANSYADGLADRGAKASEISNMDRDNIARNQHEVITVLRHHVELAVHLAPNGARPSLQGQVSQPNLSKFDRVRQLARESGHQLDAKEQCVRCGLKVPMGRNMGFLDTVLNFKCMGV